MWVSLAFLAIMEVSNFFFNSFIIVFNRLSMDCFVHFLCFKIPDSVRQGSASSFTHDKLPSFHIFIFFFGDKITVLSRVFKNKVCFYQIVQRNTNIWYNCIWGWCLAVKRVTPFLRLCHNFDSGKQPKVALCYAKSFCGWSWRMGGSSLWSWVILM